MPEPKLRFTHDLTHARPVSADVFLWFENDCRSIKKENRKINVEMSFDASLTTKLLKKFFGYLEYNRNISDGYNSKGRWVDYHGVVPGADLGRLIQRVPHNDRFTSDSTNYQLLEVGVNIGLLRNANGDIVGYDDYIDRNIEIKFNIAGNKNFRVVVDVHLTDDPGKNNIDDGVTELDDFIARLYTAPSIIEEIKRLRKVSVFNFDSYQYRLIDNGQFSYSCIVSLYASSRIRDLRTRLSDEVAARKAVEEELLDANTRIKQLKIELAAEQASKKDVQVELSTEIKSRKILDAEKKELKAQIKELNVKITQLQEEIAAQTPKDDKTSVQLKTGRFFKK